MVHDVAVPGWMRSGPCPLQCSQTREKFLWKSDPDAQGTMDEVRCSQQRDDVITQCKTSVAEIQKETGQCNGMRGRSVTSAGQVAMLGTTVSAWRTLYTHARTLGAKTLQTPRGRADCVCFAAYFFKGQTTHGATLLASTRFLTTIYDKYRSGFVRGQN